MAVYTALLEPGVPTAMFAKFDANMVIANRIALSGVADAIVKQARINASNGSHAYGTPTPASAGTGPAKISGTLYKSIDRSSITREPFGWYCRVGMNAGFVPWYAASWTSPKTSSQYARILEIEGCRNGATYPFLYSAAEFVFEIAAYSIYDRIYGSGRWARVI